MNTRIGKSKTKSVFICVNQWLVIAFEMMRAETNKPQTHADEHGPEKQD
jgi:hypothetical protein